MHPLIVHFPIVCLVLFSTIEILTFCVPRRRPLFATTKIIMLLIWIIGAFFALQTGEIAQEALGRSELIHQHEEFAEITYKIYLIIGVIYLIWWEILMLRIKPGSKGRTMYLWLYRFVTYLKHRGVVALLSLAWLITLTITWALGGAISHGPDTDPIVSYIYDLIINNSLWVVE